MTDTRSQVAEIAEQIGSSLMPDNKVWTNRFTVESTSSKAIYTVAQRRSDNVWGCSCRGWTHHRHCKHVSDILRRLAALKIAPRAFDPSVLSMLDSARTAYLDLGGAVKVKAPSHTGRVLDL